MILIIVLATLLLTVATQRPSVARSMCSSCGRSRDCSKGFCCRSPNTGNRLVDPSHEGGGFGEILEFSFRGGRGGGRGGPGGNTGMCVPGGARHHEVCSGGCPCDNGLVCYRQMSGICCLASTCRTKAYVDEQNEYWRNCHKNPRCSFPAK